MECGSIRRKQNSRSQRGLSKRQIRGKGRASSAFLRRSLVRKGAAAQEKGGRRRARPNGRGRRNASQRKVFAAEVRGHICPPARTGNRRPDGLLQGWFFSSRANRTHRDHPQS